MSRPFRWQSLLLLLLLAANLLAACAGSSAPPTAGTTAAPAEQPTSSGGGDATPEQPNVAPTDAPAGSPLGSAPLKTPFLQYGAAAQLYYTDRNRALTLMSNARMDWVRQQIHWKDIEGPKGNFGWGELDAIVADSNAKGINVLLSVVRAPSWARADGTNGMPDSVTDLGDFVEALAVRYKGKVQAYEIWNEQNLAIENGGVVKASDAAKYVDMLVEGYTRIKAVDPAAYVISGALTSTGATDDKVSVDDITYFKEMFAYKDGIIKAHADAIGFHPAPAYNPPDRLWPDEPGPGPGWVDHSTHYFRHIENLRRVMDEYGLADHQIWITEFGWATQNETPGYEYGNEISYEEQAQYVLDALQITRNNYKYVGVIIIWNLNFSVLWNEAPQPQPLHEQASFSILNTDWSPRPVYDKLQGFIAAVKAEEGR